MFDKLAATEQQYDGLLAQLASPEVQSEQTEYRKLARTLADIEPIVERFREYKAVTRDIAQTEELVAGGDPDMRELAREELKALTARRETLVADLKLLLVPKDPNDQKNVILEIRAGTGGDEAALFAGDLFRMYSRFAERQGWRIEVMSSSDTGVGGMKEVIAMIEGRNVYSRLKYESGVHRVQRVPLTESQGRVHTSTATVAVLPEVDEDDGSVEINAKDLEIDTFKASGAGGQHVNKTESAIRITHVPSGIIVSCSEERSQLQNRARAMDMLRAQLAERKRREAEEAVGSLRRSQVGTGDRSEKIRTYNYPQDRITDHRINQNYQNIKAILDGDMDRVITDLQTDERARLLAGETSAA
jgi:peptide chain release factor 1